jgi:integrase
MACVRASRGRPLGDCWDAASTGLGPRGALVTREVDANGRVHVLRHTFGARLAMAGAPAKAIQEVMGHANLSTTERYMHLTPQAARDAIHRLDAFRGDVGETKKAPIPEAN